MKSYFARLFNYDHHANKLLLEAMKNAGQPEKAVKLMAHLFTAQQVWLSRCKGLTLNNYNLWPDLDAGSLPGLMNDNISQWQDYLSGLHEADFEQFISYKNTRGDSFNTKLADILTQVTNHGTHHRAQIGQQLIFAGANALPVTDYIAYVRYIEQ